MIGLPMRIAVISDTQYRLPLEVRSAVHDADEIWHLGGVCDPECFEPLAHVRGRKRLPRFVIVKEKPGW